MLGRLRFDAKCPCCDTPLLAISDLSSSKSVVREYFHERADVSQALALWQAQSLPRPNGPEPRINKAVQPLQSVSSHVTFVQPKSKLIRDSNHWPLRIGQGGKSVGLVPYPRGQPCETIYSAIPKQNIVAVSLTGVKYIIPFQNLSPMRRLDRGPLHELRECLIRVENIARLHVAASDRFPCFIDQAVDAKRKIAHNKKPFVRIVRHVETSQHDHSNTRMETRPDWRRCHCGLQVLNSAVRAALQKHRC